MDYISSYVRQKRWNASVRRKWSVRGLISSLHKPRIKTNTFPQLFCNYQGLYISTDLEKKITNEACTKCFDCSFQEKHLVAVLHYFEKEKLDSCLTSKLLTGFLDTQMSTYKRQAEIYFGLYNGLLAPLGQQTKT